MDRNSVNLKRFVKSIRYAMEVLAGDAKCYRYEHDPEYLELKENLKFCLRELEEGEEFAGKLLFKNARRIAPSTAEAMAARAKTEEERQFFLSIAQMNRREQFLNRSKVEELAPCPICKAKPWIYEDVQDLHIVCTEDCPSPNCAHSHPRDVAMSWNTWVRWYRTQAKEE